MHTLVVSPTRELAIQIKATFDSLVKHTTIRVGCVVGGMAPTKQQRVLNRCPHVLICTPGRLWELTQKNEGCYLGHSISRRLHYVILDEADKLLQGGNRFEELKKILERVHCDVLPTGILDSGKQRKDHYGRDAHEDAEKNDDEDDDDEDSFSEGGEEGEWDPKTQKFIPKGKIRSNLSKAATAAPSSKYSRDQARPIHPPPPPPTAQHRVTTYVTSATLSLQTNYTKRDLSNKKQVIRTSNANNMQKVLQDLGIREHLANVFNLSPETGVVSKIQETYLRCPEKSKELYLYYFLRTYKERTLIFVNAISMLRRLVKILGILNIPCVALHASMQQRQRLKFIDRFKKGEKLVLIATDVASRGLDVEGLRYVIHYQVPRSTDAYIHRCGRTARCGGTGMSVMMVDATEHSAFKKLHESLGRTQSQPMEVFALEPTVVHHLHPHLQLAIQIDKLQREIEKATAGDRWVNQMSEAAELDADDMKLDEEQKLEFNGKSKALKKLRKALEAMVKKDTSHRGGKGSYRTSAKAVGVMEATKKLKERADRQSFKGSRHI